jgi:hypothetical protein
MRPRRIIAAVIVVVVAAVVAFVVLAGNKLDIPKLQRAIATLAQKQIGVKPRVTCPNRTKEKKGAQFTCTVHLDVGTVPVLVTQTDGKGNVHLQFTQPAHLLPTARLQSQLAGVVGNGATVRCPATVIERRGLNFTCTALAGGRRHTIEVTQTDSVGGIDYHAR